MPPPSLPQPFLLLLFSGRGGACCVTTEEQRGEDPQLLLSLFTNREKFDGAALGRPTLLLHFPGSCSSQILPFYSGSSFLVSGSWMSLVHTPRTPRP